MSAPNPAEILKTYFGFDTFRPGQKQVMSCLWRKGAALAVFPTGGGKSLCYQLPALMFDGLTLVVSPLLALMKDQVDFLVSRGIPATRLDSSLTADELNQVNSKIINGDYKILFVSPERFSNERFISMIKRVNVSLMAVDEAHCISEWGHNFRPDYLKLAEFYREIKAERILALTATATPEVVEDICKSFEIPTSCAVVTGFYRNNLEIITTPVRSSERTETLVKRIKSRPPGTTIVYVTLQRTSEIIAASLGEHGLPAKAYHAGMNSDDRVAVQEWWMAGTDRIVVATIAFGMGIDKSDVRYVYHYNLPKGLENYSQEIGRAGRDGLSSVVEMLVSTGDIPTLENFVYGDSPTEEALYEFVQWVYAQPTEFDLNIDALTKKFDIKSIVLKTALTYLELLGIIRQGTTRYDAYSFKVNFSPSEIAASFTGSAQELVNGIFECSQLGKTIYKIDPEAAAMKLGVTRAKIIRALEVLDERQLIKLSTSDVRLTFRKLPTEIECDEAVFELVERFGRNEELQIARIQTVIDLVTLHGCQTNALVSYFGEERSLPCGHCTFCKSGTAIVTVNDKVDGAYGGCQFESVNNDGLFVTIHDNPHVLGSPRQVAKLLCGIGSPLFTSSKLTKNELFGLLDSCRLHAVEDWCQSNLFR